jgi:SAM-dependent methyltransferase
MNELISPPPTDADFAAAREYYAPQLAAGVGRFLGERRTTCPWCGSPTLRRVLTTPDQLQGKPGIFRLDGCRTCGHVFQNPRLTPEGLDFYYRDCYDGLGAASTEAMFAACTPFYLDRARMVAPFATPKRWLDVGTGYGHFPRDARQVWPDTVFDGLDFGAGVEAGLARGWLDSVHRGTLAEFATDAGGRDLFAQYDVLSMHHYLEHTTEPRAELDLVASVLRPGALLQIEVPDPTSVVGRLLGRWWAPWGQPQHLHLIPQANLLAALVERGFTPVAVDRASAHLPVDLTYAVMAALAAVAPEPRVPWVPQRAFARRRFLSGWKAATPPIRAAYKADQALLPVIRRADAANTYRVLARRDG